MCSSMVIQPALSSQKLLQSSHVYQDQENIFYYITVMNENYQQPAMPDGVETGIPKGIYLLSEGKGNKKRVQLMGSGTILREVIAAGELLEADFDVAANVWSVTSFNEPQPEEQQQPPAPAAEEVETVQAPAPVGHAIEAVAAQRLPGEKDSATHPALEQPLEISKGKVHAGP